ncbi:hypothetical protein [Desulfonatronospira sp.]|uniref:hypothetical protein n=1 Tax=Desulfonatronospira sp. TaxID=1962951 RepID=UPI0025BE546B|nr:hypothetical protein [Desulfonatronospira sp.]
MEEKSHSAHFDIKQVYFIDSHSILKKILLNGDSINNSKETCKTYSSKYKDKKLIHWHDFYKILLSWNNNNISQNELKNFFNYCQDLQKHENKLLYVDLDDKYFVYRYLPLVKINNILKIFADIKNKSRKLFL